MVCPQSVPGDALPAATAGGAVAGRRGGADAARWAHARGRRLRVGLAVAGCRVGCRAGRGLAMQSGVAELRVTWEPAGRGVDPARAWADLARRSAVGRGAALAGAGNAGGYWPLGSFRGGRRGSRVPVGRDLTTLVTVVSGARAGCLCRGSGATKQAAQGVHPALASSLHAVAVRTLGDDPQPAMTVPTTSNGRGATRPLQPIDAIRARDGRDSG
jgi:hypothetical protein